MNILGRKNVVACAVCGRRVGGFWPAGNRSMRPRRHKNDDRQWCDGTNRSERLAGPLPAGPTGTGGRP